MTLPTVTVLIATYNRARQLLECLQALAVQEFEAEDQVIVVDNASTDDTRAVVQQAAAWFPIPIQYLFEPTAGKSHALALGLGCATGDVIALTDDDVIVAPDWIERIRCVMADSSIALVAGRVEPRWEIEPPAWLRFEKGAGYSKLASPLALVDYGDQPSLLEDRAALGANMAVRRRALDSVGGFPLALGKLRGTLLSGEDRYVCERLREIGCRCMYVPAIVVHHWVPRERLSLGYFARWFFWSGITNSALEGVWPVAPPKRRSVLGIPVYLIRQAAAAAAVTVASLLTGRPARAVEHGADVAFALGYIAHRWRASCVRMGYRAPAGPQPT
ncbi:MAG TPA: glycosyltransferase [Vicinamibacterales bacterium]|nr:glycosyltransferase [Vicinamibacterales bacterium]